MKKILTSLLACLALAFSFAAPAQAVVVDVFKVGLDHEGQVSETCSSRWVSNQYGAACYFPGIKRFFIKDETANGRGAAVEWSNNGNRGICQNRRGAGNGWQRCGFPRIQAGTTISFRVGDCHHVQSNCADDSSANYNWGSWYIFTS